MLTRVRGYLIKGWCALAYQTLLDVYGRLSRRHLHLVRKLKCLQFYFSCTVKRSINIVRQRDVKKCICEKCKSVQKSRHKIITCEIVSMMQEAFFKILVSLQSKYFLFMKKKKKDGNSIQLNDLVEGTNFSHLKRVLCCVRGFCVILRSFQCCNIKVSCQ